MTGIAILIIFIITCALGKEISKIEFEQRCLKADIKGTLSAVRSAHQKISSLESENKELKRQLLAMRVDDANKNFAKHGGVHNNIV